MNFNILKFFINIVTCFLTKFPQSLLHAVYSYLYAFFVLQQSALNI